MTPKVAPASPPHIMSPPVEDTAVKSTSQPADEHPLALASSTPSAGQNMECDGNLATRLCPLQSPKEEENSQNNIIYGK
ncbi:unnamed protein product [Parnassius mnemosyne]|uniref:Uncharacterized protein n=1 Tax=Parnassius mnemosyne TaxID=213953 RepID=A0AAV1LKM5_9NEOP